MPTIINDPPASTYAVTLTTNTTGPSLVVETPAGPLEDEEQLYIKHRRPAETDPVTVPITFAAPAGWDLSVEHHDDGVPRPWPQTAPGQCSLTWAETGGEKKVVVTATPPSSSGEAPKQATVFIKVGPDPELPV